MTITVRSISALEGGAEVLIAVRLASGENFEDRRLILPMQSCVDLRVQKGEIGEELFEELSSEAEIYAALKRGMNILGYGACSERSLVLKLRSKGFSRTVSEAAARRLCERGYINESEDARREAERCLKKYWGRKRIEAQLYSKGFSREAAHIALESLDEVDFSDLCATLISKKMRSLPMEANEQKKLFASLMRYGYTSSEVKKALMILGDKFS